MTTTTTGTTEPLISGGALSMKLGRPESTIRLWTKQGFIPAIRMPGARTRYLYRLSDVLSALEGFRTDERTSA